MRRNVLITACLLLLSCAIVSAQVMGAQVYGQQRGYDPNAPKHDVSGSVVNSATGEGIANALVQMFGQYQSSALTDSQGSFHFQGVPEGQVMLMARKPGFFSPDELSRGGGRPRAPVRITADTGSLVLKLSPEGLVTGTITGDDGEPVENVRVHLKRQVVTNGRKQWEERSQASTNEDGEFRAANLVPGTYFMLVDAARPRTPRMPDASSDYAATYYPGAPDLSSAASIDVRAGQNQQVDFRLRSQPVYEVSGVVTGIPPGQRGANVQFMNRSGDAINANLRFNAEDGSFTARLPGGTYVVKASSFEPPRRNWTASTTITVGGNLANLRLPLQPSASIPVVVRTEFTRQESVLSGVTSASLKERTPAQLVSVQLTGADNPRQNAFYGGTPDNPAIDGVEPGRYAVQISPHGPWYVQSASYGQTDLLRDDLIVGQADSRAIEITLRDDGGSITGSAISDNVAVPASVLVVPERRSMPRMAFASERGLNIGTLAPGDYLLFAFDSTDGLEYTDRQALDPYVSRATRVTVSANGNANVTLTLIKRGEP